MGLELVKFLIIILLLVLVLTTTTKLTLIYALSILLFIPMISR